MKTKVEFAGVVVIGVDGGKYMCGTTTDGRFAHTYLPEGKRREVMCVHTTAEACYAHDKVLGTCAGKQMSKKVKELLDWEAKNGFCSLDLGDCIG